MGHAMHKHIAYHSTRTKCPSCDASRGFARFKSIDGKPCDSDQHGHCHACGQDFWPDQQSRDHHQMAQPKPQRDVAAAVAVRDGVLDETDEHTSNLHRVLINIGGDAMAAHLRQWKIGTDCDGRTLFHYITASQVHASTKGMLYDINGNRNKDSTPGHSARFGIKLRNEYLDLRKDKGYRPGLFGAQWMQPGQVLIDYRDISNPKMCKYDAGTPIILVESEKSAVLGSFILPQMIWLAAGGTQGLTKEKAETLSSRLVILLFDTDDAGRKACASAAKVLRDAGAKAIDQIDGKAVQDVIFGIDSADGYDVGDHVMQLLINQNIDSQNGRALPISSAMGAA